MAVSWGNRLAQDLKSSALASFLSAASFESCPLGEILLAEDERARLLDALGSAAGTAPGPRVWLLPFLGNVGEVGGVCVHGGSGREKAVVERQVEKVKDQLDHCACSTFGVEASVHAIKGGQRSPPRGAVTKPRRLVLLSAGAQSVPAALSLPAAILGAGAQLDDFRLNRFEVVEARSKAEREAAYILHMEKDTFQEERELVRRRIFEGDDPMLCCRTWLLGQRAACDALDSCGMERGTGNLPGSQGGTIYAAAVTVKLNAYRKGFGRWAQIMNLSSRYERRGLGTLLIAGLEELLRGEDVDIVVLYPAWNGKAPAFWSSLGFGACRRSQLPPEELVPFESGGPLVPEFETGQRAPLPRWEKRIADCAVRREDARPVRRLGGEALLLAAQGLRAQNRAKPRAADKRSRGNAEPLEAPTRHRRALSSVRHTASAKLASRNALRWMRMEAST